MYEGLTMKPHKTSVTTVYGQDEVDKANDSKDQTKDSMQHNNQAGVFMERMIIGIIASALIGLGAWNLNQTFNLSIEIENVKGKIDVLENSIKQISKKKKKKGSIMQQSN